MSAARPSSLGGRDAFLIVIICFAWAGNFLSSTLALREFPPLLFTALRLILLALLLGAFLKRPAPGQWPRLIAVGLSNGVLHFGLGFWSMKLSTTLASPAILMQSYVPIAALLAWRLKGERPATLTAAAIGLSFLGVLVLGFDPSVLQRPLALVLMLISAFFLALGTVLMRELKGLDVFSQQGWTAVVGIVPLLAWSFAVEPPALEAMRRASLLAWSGVAYAAVIASLVGHGLYYLLVQRHPVAQVTPYLLATPLLATVLGILFMNDTVGPRLWLGGAMVLGGVMAIAVREVRRIRV
ncbi:MAG: family transporter [Myxococcaceae bacterium]|nr:family transporter [Myxococcaceae bacterium]